MTVLVISTVTIGSIAAGQSVTALPSGTTTVTGSSTVSGTVTALPSGTETVAGTVTALPSGITTVTGTVPPGFTANLRGSGNTTGTGAVTLIAAQGASTYIHVTDIEIGNSGTLTNVLTFNDGSSLQLVNTAGTPWGKSFGTPLVLAANTALTFTPSAGSSTTFAAAQGYVGTIA